MKTVNKIAIITLGIVLLVLIGCKEDKIAPWENNTTPPGPISNITIVNQPAQATITYTLPRDKDLLYVKAVYPLQSGAIREVKASYYTNTMVLDGFGEAGTYDVKLYAVNRSEVESEPVTIQVEPLKNPIWDVFETMEILPDFAGVRIKALNEFRADVTIEVLRKDSLGEWEKFGDDIYTSIADISNTTRGLDTVAQMFGATVRDRFMNYTDTVFTTIKPLFEEALDKSKFRELRLPGDADIQTVTAGMRLIWDGDANSSQSQRMLTTTDNHNPQWITFDTGQESKLSRFKTYNYTEFVGGNRFYYYRGQFRYFELWGTTQYSLDGSFDSWTLLGTYEVKKPSGLPYGQQTTEDFNFAEAGFEFDVDPNAPKVRYLRIKSNQNWEGSTWMELLEINLYGDTRK
ncbi:DUF5000 domain-containing lipoprotein [Prevotella sp. 10(H)]|uniref:DUF5000 domain-containing lipoprotein n=1 Tax=Prevotella sp. 10(H) TaxID=1158294 RepID=UPI0004A6CCD9|nr:DUF5000 domain-containing lipoprotein [Prevotella sp. 10(H)]